MAISTEKCLVVDVDGTLCPIKRSDQSYSELEPYAAVIAQLRRYHAEGFRIILHTARNMRTHDGNIGAINVLTLPPLLEWLDRHDIPYDEVHVAKPWAGRTGFYVDDRAIRPDEFLTNDLDALGDLIADARDRLERLNGEAEAGRDNLAVLEATKP